MRRKSCPTSSPSDTSTIITLSACKERQRVMLFQLGCGGQDLITVPAWIFESRRSFLVSLVKCTAGVSLPSSGTDASALTGSRWAASFASRAA